MEDPHPHPVSPSPPRAPHTHTRDSDLLYSIHQLQRDPVRSLLLGTPGTTTGRPPGWRGPVELPHKDKRHGETTSWALVPMPPSPARRRGALRPSLHRCLLTFKTRVKRGRKDPEGHDEEVPVKSSGHVGMPRAPATTRLCPLPSLRSVGLCPSGCRPPLRAAGGR